LISGGALDWGPVKRLAPVEVVATRFTTSATVRRVPRPEALLAGLEPMEGLATADSAETDTPDRVPAPAGH
jgi:hypothetical protein